jgi:Tol biopolymer transport system component
VRWAFLLVCGCGRIAFDPLSGSGTGPGDAGDAAADSVDALACVWSPWSAPQLLPQLMSNVNDWEPAVSPDGSLLVYGQSNTTTGTLEAATWQGTMWSAPATIPVLDTSTFERGPEWNATGTRFYFSSDRTGQTDLYQSDYSGGTFSPPVLVPGLTAVRAESPTLSTDEREMFYTSVGGLNLAYIGRATRASTTDPWTDLGAVPDLAVSTQTGWPSLSADGNTIYFEDDATGGSIYIATRSAPGAPFVSPTPVAELNTAGHNGDPDLSLDGKTMLFASTRAGGASQYDLYVSTRSCN